MERILGLVLLMGLLALMGCEGDQGPAGEDGHDGISVSEYTFVGENGVDCIHCHTELVASVMLTRHTLAYESLAEEPANLDNPYCLKCHTTGWDSEVSYGDTEIAVYGADVNGFDDYWGVEGAEAAARRADLEGVQCESCHGAMGPTFNANQPIVSLSSHEVGGVSTSMCAPCHNGQLDEWATSGHANAAGGDIAAFQDEGYASSRCGMCHTSEGFIAANDPSFADYAGEYTFIGCVTCHDPHAGSMGDGNVAQLRTVGAVETNYDPATEPGDELRPRMEGYGPAQLCAQCHHGRRDNANVAGQIADGYGHFGPHYSAQMDMFIGAGSYVIPDEIYDTTHVHQNITHACVDCHMVRETFLHGEMQDHSFHTFTPDVGNCTSCHPSWTDFTALEVYQASVHAKMDELAVLFDYADWDAMHDDETGWDSEAEGVEAWQREAAYAMYFVYADGSMGAHNPSYTEDLLQNAIDYYTLMSTK